MPTSHAPVLTRDEIVAIVGERNEKALLADGFEGAFVGVARHPVQPTLAAHSVRKALRILVDRDGMSEEEAIEFFDFNVVGAWRGPHTPI
jgi:hypothetical protein